MINVYFGPYKHSPAPELPPDENRLWLADFSLLRGFDRDFWTNNAAVLDVFDLRQIFVWQNEWVELRDALDQLVPDWEKRPVVKGLACGRLALLCEILWQAKKREKMAQPPGVR